MAIIEHGDLPLPFDENELALFGDAEPLRSEPQGFAIEQMVTCDACLRANPPTRTNCLYCSELLPATKLNPALLKPTLRKLEEWERGFNVIYLPETTSILSDATLTSVAELLKLELENLKLIVQAERPMPLARSANQEEAALIKARLADLGVNVRCIADSELVEDNLLPRRVRAFDLTEGEFAARPSAASVEVVRVGWSEITLIVLGRLFTRQLEVEERKHRKAEGEIVEARELSSDESMLDIYFDGQARAVRISAGNFDFSCLGTRKGLIAGQNFATMVSMLRERASHALFDESYTPLRHAITPVWPVEEHTEGRGWRRKGPGRVNTEAVTTSSNDLQFTRYSRLLNHLRMNRLDPSK
ncbi:MAG: hypothetical protein QOJ64_2686 [Acidobacteriota bacterium]|jgi:hypothetical protein|nr:hypothetical protein [Acidobacteriota bacterium]